MKKFNLILIALLIFIFTVSPVIAAETVPGDVIVMFKNNTESRVSAASLAADDNNSSSHLSLAEAAAASVGGKLSHVYTALSEQTNSVIAVIHSDTKSEQDLLAELKSRPDVQGASLNYIRKLCASPNDKYYSRLWGVKAINAEKVWDAGYTGDKTVYAAVMDSGLENNHEDLAGIIDTEHSTGYTYDYEKNTYLPSHDASAYQDDDKTGHGTHVSGIIAGLGNNNLGVTGVNWNTNIIMYKVRVTKVKNGKEITGISDTVTIMALEDIAKLKKSGLNIASANMSLGGWDSHGAPEDVSNSSDPYWAALKAVSDAGVVLCISAGNNSQRVGYPAPCDSSLEGYLKGEYIYPASYRNIENMIVVAAASMDADGNYIRSARVSNAANSNYGSEYVHVAAPGEAIISSVPNNYLVQNASGDYVKLIDYPTSNQLVEAGVNNYASWAGTSMSAPYVAGAVALLKSAFPSATAEQLTQAVFDGANGDYCKNDTVEYNNIVDILLEITHPDDHTSKYGFLDVKGAYDKLTGLVPTRREDEADKYSSDIALKDGEKLVSSGDIKAYDLKITNLDSSLQEAANSGDISKIAVLDAFNFAEAGTYMLKITLDSGHSAGRLQFFNGENGTYSTSGLKSAADETNIEVDSTAKFYDEDGYAISSISKDDSAVIVSAYFKSNTDYTPVLSVNTAADSGSGRKSSSGCDAGVLNVSALILLALAFKNLKNKAVK